MGAAADEHCAIWRKRGRCLGRERPAAEEFHFDLPPQGISLEGVEKELIVRALEKFNWNQTHAAQYLDISRKTLIYRMEKFGLRKEQAATEDQRTE